MLTLTTAALAFCVLAVPVVATGLLIAGSQLLSLGFDLVLGCRR